jgi:DNA-binding response OmpR family regulator
MYMHALIIEPQVFTSFVIEDALRDAGYTSITLARTEEEAIAAADADPPDMVTCAVELEPGNGIRAAQAIRSRHDTAVLFITQRPAEVSAEETDPVMVRKPFLAEQLPPAIAEAELRCPGPRRRAKAANAPQP